MFFPGKIWLNCIVALRFAWRRINKVPSGDMLYYGIVNCCHVIQSFDSLGKECFFQRLTFSRGKLSIFLPPVLSSLGHLPAVFNRLLRFILL